MVRAVRVGGWMAAAVLSAAGLGAAARDVRVVDAVKKSDTAAVRTLIQQRVDVNAPEVDGTTALHWAARRDDLEATDLLLKAGANVKAANRYGVTPLAVAAVNANPAMIERLVKAGADPNTVSGEGETVLMTVARTGRLDAVKILIANGANVNAKESWKGQTALMWASAEGHAPVVQALLDAGADMKVKSTRGFSAFQFAVREGQIDAMRVLLKAGANPNELLVPLARNADTPINPDQPPVEGSMTPLLLAVMSAHFEAASVLLDAGADPNFDGLGYTALHLVSWVRKPGSGANFPGPIGSGAMDSLSFVRKMAAKGANLNARMTKTPRNGPQAFQSFLNWKGATPFLTAARSVDAPLMRLLAELGADPLLPNEDDTQPLLVAAGIGVRSAGEDPGTESEILDAVTLAIELGGDVNSVDKNGETVMHGAAVRGLDSLIQLLADKGAKVSVWNTKNSRGVTPVNMAEGYRRKNGSFQSQPQVAPLFKKLIAQAEGQSKGQ